MMPQGSPPPPIAVPPRVFGYRWVLLGVMALLYFLNFADRMSFATVLPLVRRDLGLDHAQAGWAVSVFFLGYGLAQLSAGHLADRVGPKRTIVIALSTLTLGTFFLGLVRSLPQLLALRFLLAFGEGHHFVPSLRTLANWFPQREKGRATGLFSTSWMAASFVAPVATGFIAAAGSWRAVFLLFPLVGAAGLVLLYFLFVDTPDGALAKGRVTAEEHRYIKAGLAPDIPRGTKGLYKALFRDRIFWVYACLCVFNAAIYWGSTAWLSSFLLEQHGFSVAATGLFVAAPYVVGLFSLVLGGWLVDRLRSARLVLLCAYLGAAPSFLALSRIPTSIPLILAALALVGFFTSLSWTPIYAVIQMRYPKEVVGTALGVTNSLAMVGALSSPFAAGYLVRPTATGYSYEGVFLMLVAVSALSALATLLLREKPLAVVPEGPARR